MVTCERCGAELAVADGLCAPCTAEGHELDVRIVESDRPRYEGSGARLETKLTDTHRKASRMKTVEYTWENATIGMGIGDNPSAHGWKIVFAVAYDGHFEIQAQVVSIWHHGKPVEVTPNHQTYWSARFKRDGSLEALREDFDRLAEVLGA